MNPSPAPSSRAALVFDPFLVGTFFGVLSSLGYTGANICLRSLTHCDPLLVSCIKAVPTMLLAGSLVVIGLGRGRVRLPSTPVLLALVVTGTFAQLGGNGFFQWSMSEVGLALTVPLCSGAMIVSAAVMGRFWLGEGVTPRSAVALLLLVVAIAVLSAGAEESPQIVELATASAPLGVALAAACFSGLAYATLNVTIRRVVRGTVSMPVVLLIVSSMGVISLGLGSTWRIGWDAVERTSPNDLSAMFVAGTFNAVGFFSLTKALQLVSIVQVNAVSASQSALAALAGVALFGEALTASLVTGVALTIAGMGLIDRGRSLSASARPNLAESDTPVVGDVLARPAE